MYISSEYFGVYLKKFREKQRIILYGEKKLVDNLKKHTETCGYAVSECYYCDENVGDSYVDIMYEEPGEYFVWIVSTEYIDLCKNLDEIGLIQHQDYATVFRPPYMNLYQRFPLDTHMGYTSNTDSKYPGVVVFGEEKSDENMIRIVTLGGSTSDAMTYPWKSWSEILYEKFVSVGINNVIIYSAGVCGYGVAQELVKLQRDMLSVHPNIVISLSGFNNIGERINSWYSSYQENMVKSLSIKGIGDITNGKNGGYSVGIEEKISPAEMWIKNIRMMNAVCLEFGVKFFSFLQPMVGTPGLELKETAKEYLKSEFVDTQKLSREFILDIRKVLDEYDYMCDISGAFLNHEEVFIDSVHVTETGNEIIASEIWNVVKEALRI